MSAPEIEAGSSEIRAPSIDHALSVPPDAEFESMDLDDPSLEGADGRFRQNLDTSYRLLRAPRHVDEKLQPEEAPALYVAMHEMWFESTLSVTDMVDRNFRAFVDPDNIREEPTLSENMLQNCYNRVKYQWAALDRLVERCDMPSFYEEVKQLRPDGLRLMDPRQGIKLMAEKSYYGYQLLFCINRLINADSKHYVQALPDRIGYGKFAFLDHGKNTDHQDLLQYLYRKIADKGFRKKDDEYYKQIVTQKKTYRVQHDDGTMEEMEVGGFYTHAYKKKNSIDQLVYKNVNRFENYEQWQKLTSGTSMKPVIDKLTNLLDPDFPQLESDRHIISFQDGIYDVRYDDFYTYDYDTPVETRENVRRLNMLRTELERYEELTMDMREQNRQRIEAIKEAIIELHEATRMRGSDLLPSELVSANYIPRDFVPDECESFGEYDQLCPTGASVPTPSFDRILDYQNFDEKQKQAECSVIKCRNRAMFGVRCDTRGRFCSEHKLPGMQDFVTPRCSEDLCTAEARWNLGASTENGEEAPVFCDQHKPVDCTTLQPLHVTGSYNDDANPGKTTKQILKAMIGRLLYNVAEKDNWQVIPFLKGHANTGKSTLINVVQKFYSPEDVHVLSNNIERKFGLEPIMDKYLFLGPEIKENLGLDQAEFQTLVSGDPMSVARKFKSAISVNWKVPGILAGNVAPKWSDKAGSIARRVLTFPFDTQVKYTDTYLQDEIMKELPRIIRACNLHYLSMVEELKATNSSIWNIVPTRLIAARKEMQESLTGDLSVFFNKTDAISVADGPDKSRKWIPWSVLEEEYIAWARENNVREKSKLDIREVSSYLNVSLGVEVDFNADSQGVPRERFFDHTNRMEKGPFLVGLQMGRGE